MIMESKTDRNNSKTITVKVISKERVKDVEKGTLKKNVNNIERLKLQQHQ